MGICPLHNWHLVFTDCMMPGTKMHNTHQRQAAAWWRGFKVALDALQEAAQLLVQQSDSGVKWLRVGSAPCRWRMPEDRPVLRFSQMRLSCATARVCACSNLHARTLMPTHTCASLHEIGRSSPVGSYSVL